MENAFFGCKEKPQGNNLPGEDRNFEKHPDGG